MSDMTGVRNAAHWFLGAFVAIIFATALPGYASAAYRLITLHAFCAKSGCADGSDPLASLVMDASAISSA